MKCRSWILVTALGFAWFGACTKRGKSTAPPVSSAATTASDERPPLDSGGQRGSTSPTQPLDSASTNDSAGAPETGSPTEDPPRVLGDLEAVVLREGTTPGGELGSKVAWVGDQVWVSEPGGGGIIHRLPDGPTFTAADPEAHLGVALSPYGAGVLAGAWSREGHDDATGAVYLLTADSGNQMVERDLSPVVVLEDGVVGVVLLGEGAGAHPDGWLLGQPRFRGDRGRISLRSAIDHSLVAEWHGSDTGELAGGSMATPDLNGDGLRDLATGAWGQSTFAGRVYAVHAPFSESAVLSDADGAWTGERWTLAGYTLAAGDVTGDGLDDLVVGSFGDTRNGSGSGAFTVVPAGSSGGPLVALDAHRLGDGPDAHFSAGLALADIDQDGFVDITAGAPDGMAGGVARVYYGPIEGVGTAWDAQLLDPASAPRDGLGGAMALHPDHGWVVGAPGASERQGRVLFAETTLLQPE